MALRHRIALVCLLIAAALLPASPVAAQAVYGSIAGTVTDPTGAALPGVTVTITSVERKIADTVVTNADGLYVKERLLPGIYEVKAELQGFKSAVVSSARVSVDTQTKVDLKLEVGGQSETITVSAAAGQLLKTDRADVAITFEQRQITELPIIDRNFTKLHPAHPGHPAPELEPRRQREPAGVAADDGQRPALQRHRVTSSTAPRTATRSSASSSSTRTSRRSARPRSPRRTTTRSSARRPRASSPCRPSRGPTDPRQRLRVPPERQVPGAQPVQPARHPQPPHRPRAAGDEERPVRRLDRRAHHEEQDASSSPTTRAAQTPSAARSCSRCRPPWPAPAT